MKQIVTVGLLLVISTTALAVDEVNVYSARKEKLIKPLFDTFTQETGIKVNMVTGKADALLKRLEAEGRNSPADLLITVDAGRLHRADKVLHLLQPVNSLVLNQAVPVHLRSPDGLWFGLSQRARPIFYVPNKLDAKQLSSYEDLADPKWKGKICIRSSSNIYNQSLVASMVAHLGEAKTEAWAKGLVGNFAIPPRGGDRDQIKAAAAGICDLAIANTYYFGHMLRGKDKVQAAAAAKVKIFWPNQADRGVHVNVSGIGLTRSAKHQENAIKLMEFLVNETSQFWYAKVNYEYPVRAGVSWGDTLKSWGTFKADTLNLSKLGEFNATAVKIMDRAGWK